MHEARALVAAVGLFLVAAPLLSLARQATILLVGAALGWSARLVETHVLPVLPVDPVYGGAGLRVLGGIEPYGLAVAGSPGRWLHVLMPSLFSDPVLAAPGAAVSALVEPGITVLAHLVTAILATSLLVAWVDVLAHLAARRLARPALGVATRLGQVWLLLDLAREANLSLRDLEATGLPFVLAAFSPVDAHGQRVLVTTYLEQAPAVLVSAGNAALAICSCLLFARLLVTSGRTARLLATSRRQRSYVLLPAMSGPRRPWPWMAPRPSSRRLAHAGLVIGLPLLVSLTPFRLLAEGEIAAPPIRLIEEASQPQDVPLAAHEQLAATPVPAHTPVAAVTPSITPGPPATTPQSAVSGATAPSAAEPAPTASSTHAPAAVSGRRVSVEGGNYRYRLLVNGQPWVVRGMGYNPWYADLPAEERRALYRRDFSLMRETGINTLEGWFQNQFDEVTLDEAHRQGLKVIMPFELNQDYDYADPAVQERFRAEVTAWVLRYRDHPAVLMWGPGNEVLHRLIFPTAVQGQRDPSREQRADDFARFYVELMDRVHQLDPHHPVIYRDAEDLYLARFLAQLRQRPADRPWFVYGTNVYTSRIAEVIERWPAQGIDAPLLVSEFSPGGASASDRPGMFGWYWSTIRAHPERVLGGVVYTWTTRGPEDLDRVFGLTNEAGAPVDGSLGALRQLFRPSATVSSAPRRPRPSAGREDTRNLRSAVSAAWTGARAAEGGLIELPTESASPRGRLRTAPARTA
jgi:hypothetical protein